MSKISILTGIGSDFSTFKGCLSPIRTHYKKGETIADFSDILNISEKIGILVRGRAYLYAIDIDGRYNLIEIYEENDVFGRIFLSKPSNLDFIIVACSNCEVLYLDYHKVNHCCENNCPDHTRLLSNLFRISVYKSEQLVIHLNILSCRTIQSKLMAYLEHESDGRKEFTIPLKMGELADYLCVDRCAMLRELKNMRDEGLIASKGRHFTLL